MRKQVDKVSPASIETDNQNVQIYRNCEVKQNEQNEFCNVKTIQRKYWDCSILTRIRKSIFGILFILTMLILIIGLTISKFKMLREDFTPSQIQEPLQQKPQPENQLAFQISNTQKYQHKQQKPTQKNERPDNLVKTQNKNHDQRKPEEQNSEQSEEQQSATEQIKYPCAKKYKIVHIWVGTKPLPLHYKKYIDRCKDNTILLGNDDLKTYIDKWNQDQPEHFISIERILSYKVAVHTDLLRKLYLYFESGIYSDFDTVIDEQCFDNIITDEIIFTNSWGSEVGIVMPEQNFMRVLKKRNPNMKRWIYAQLAEEYHGGTRWNQCTIKPCFVINCQQHNYEGTWK